VLLAIGIGREHVIAVPARGGTLSIGFVGTPQTINPIFARPGTVDYALTKMLFRGLTRVDDQLQVQPDLAEDISPSADGKVYTIRLRDGEQWSDGHAVTADDVKFTYDVLKDASYRSPYQSLFAPISTEVIDERTLRLTTTQPSALLLNTLSIGLLPQHIWLDASSASIALAEYNIKPVGNGAWKFQNVIKDRSGVIKSYSFLEQKTARAKSAYIHAITVKLYGDRASAVEALRKESIDLLTNTTSSDLEILEKKAVVHTLPINQVIGLWLNQNTAPIFQHSEVRKALAMALHTTDVVKKELGTQVTPIQSPILRGYPGFVEPLNDVPAQAAAAQQLLTDAGWKKNSAGIWTLKKEVLRFSVSVPNDPAYVSMATAFVQQWKQLGFDASVRTVDTTTIAKDVVRPRLYDVLLFGQQYGADGDLYAYWHSSQQKDPGFALAIWSNSTADQALQKARTAVTNDARSAAMRDFQSIVQSSVPAILLGQSRVTVAHHTDVRGFYDARVGTIGDLYALLPQVYLKTKWAWK
jgi:peptide/nickel transport system substrate-binding protein